MVFTETDWVDLAEQYAMIRFIRWNPFFIGCLLFCTAVGLFIGQRLLASEVPMTIAQVHYSGGGDWYGDATVIKNWLRLLRTRADIETAEARVILKLTDHTLYQYPMLYLVGHGNIQLTEAEVEALRDYLMNGGFLFANDDYGLDESFRREMQRVFPEQELQPIPNTHLIYRCFYELKGLPKIHEHDGEPAQGFGLFHDGRMVVYYVYSSDIGDGLEDADVHPEDTPQVRELAAKMAVNIAVYALTH